MISVERQRKVTIVEAVEQKKKRERRLLLTLILGFNAFEEGFIGALMPCEAGRRRVMAGDAGAVTDETNFPSSHSSSDEDAILLSSRLFCFAYVLRVDYVSNKT